MFALTLNEKLHGSVRMSAMLPIAWKYASTVHQELCSHAWPPCHHKLFYQQHETHIPSNRLAMVLSIWACARFMVIRPRRSASARNWKV